MVAETKYDQIVALKMAGMKKSEEIKQLNFCRENVF